MQFHRLIIKAAALAGLAVALLVGSATFAGAQDNGYEGEYEGEYEGPDDCPEGYEGYEGYEGCEGGGDTDPDETATPIAPTTSSPDTLPVTGGAVVLGLAGAVTLTGLALRRLSRS